MKNIESTANEYKTILLEIELLEKRRKLLRDGILELYKNDDINVYGLRIDVVNPLPSINWKKAQEALGIEDCTLEPFKTERNSYSRLIAVRGIIL